MPQPKEKAAMYVRESRVELYESNTIESQANAVRLYCDKEGYSLSLEHEYIEAISGYTVVYTERERLMDMLAAAKRREFSVLVVSEIRALSRRGQAEIFILYDFLKKYGVRLETISEKFEDSAMGRFMLSVRAMVAEVERENTYSRTTRGRIDRLKGGAMNGHPVPHMATNLWILPVNKKPSTSLTIRSFLLMKTELSGVLTLSVWKSSNSFGRE